MYLKEILKIFVFQTGQHFNSVGFGMVCDRFFPVKVVRVRNEKYDKSPTLSVTADVPERNFEDLCFSDWSTLQQ